MFISTMVVVALETWEEKSPAGHVVTQTGVNHFALHDVFVQSQPVHVPWSGPTLVPFSHVAVAAHQPQLSTPVQVAQFVYQLHSAPGAGVTKHMP